MGDLIPAFLSPREKADEGIQLTERGHPEPEQQQQQHSRPSMAGPFRDDDDENGRVHGSTEATPFITTAISPGGDVTEEDDPRVRLRWPVILYSFTIVFLVEIALNICWPAWNAMLEQGICAEMHPDLAGLLVAGDGLDPRCKEADVQGKLAMYRGWSYTIDALPSTFVKVWHRHIQKMMRMLADCYRGL